jgi:hypothetical protein
MQVVRSQEPASPRAEPDRKIRDNGLEIGVGVAIGIGVGFFELDPEEYGSCIGARQRATGRTKFLLTPDF